MCVCVPLPLEAKGVGKWLRHTDLKKLPDLIFIYISMILAYCIKLDYIDNTALLIGVVALSDNSSLLSLDAVISSVSPHWLVFWFWLGQPVHLRVLAFGMGITPF